MERVLVSSEIENIIDKDNILGQEDTPDFEKNISVAQSERKISGYLKSLDSSAGLFSFEILILKSELSSCLPFLNSGEKSIYICDELFFQSSKTCAWSFSLGVEKEEKDMYIWKIIIDNSA